MSEQVAEPVRLSSAELRTLFLFEALDDDQLSWLSENGYSQTWLAGEEIYTEGDPSTYFFVLLSGTLSIHAAWRTPRWSWHAPTNAACTLVPHSHSSNVWMRCRTGVRYVP